MFKKTEGEVTESAQLTPQPTRAPIEPGKVRAIIGPSIVIKGDLSGDEDVLVQGKLEGTIQLKKHNLTVGKEGSVKANVRAQVINIDGEVEGDLIGDERIIIHQSGNVRGNLVAPRVILEDGAKFKGSIDMDVRAEQRQSPPLRAVAEEGPKAV